MPHSCKAQVLLHVTFAHGPLNLFAEKKNVQLFLTRRHSAGVFSRIRNLEKKKELAAFYFRVVGNLFIFALCILTWLQV